MAKDNEKVKESNPYVPMSVFLALCCVALATVLGIVYVEGEETRRMLNEYKKAAEMSSKMSSKMSTGSDKVSMCEREFINTTQNPEKLSVFDDLTPAEYKSFAAYLNDKLGLAKTGDNLNSSYILLIDLLLPDKQEALNYLDQNGPKPVRKAHVVVYRGNYQVPIVEEYTVTMQNDTYTHHMLQTVPWNNRPIDDVEETAIDDNLINPFMERIYSVLTESYNASYHNCTDHCLSYSWIMPYGSRGAHRQFWVWFFRFLPHEILHPLGLEILLNTAGVDVSQWSVEKIIYNKVAFDTVDEFLAKYNNGSVEKLHLPWPDNEDALFSDMKKRGDNGGKHKMAPELFEPNGRRYNVSGRHIDYMGWSFDFRVSAAKSLQLYDIRFNGERIVYELGMQDSGTVYAGYEPINMFTTYIESTEFGGWRTYELGRGIDCPRTAVFFDNNQYINGKVKKFRNAVCAFELDPGLPLRRHYSTDYDEEDTFLNYGGMVDHVLVLRAVYTNYNYDFIMDYVFHQNGAMETKLSLAGYLQTSLYTPAEDNYAYQIFNDLSGAFHHHLAHYKVDLDVLGTSNRVGSVKFRVENITNPWFPNERHYQYNVRTRYYAKNESEAAFKENFDNPGYTLFFNDAVKNKYNRHRAYRLKVDSPSKLLLPEDLGTEPGLSWARYQVAVTKRKENEQSSSSIYNGVNSKDPLVKFQDYIDDTDSLEDEDLVAWVSLGAHHYPSTDDLPTTTTTQAQMRFFLLPFNYHDEDASMGSPSAIYVTPAGGTERYGTPEASNCLPPMDRNYKYYGKLDEV